MRIRNIIIVASLSFGISNLQAQTAMPATGGDATGTGGSASYTVGQVTYATNTGTGGTVSQGAQQPFEITVETGIEQQGINLECVVYPNPVTDYLILSVETMHASSNMVYQLFDTKGQLITTNKVTTAETKIVTNNLTQGNYLLRVVGNNQAIKTFKIIKN